jgi:hypothetical protein
MTHDAVMQQMRELADDMQNWPDEDNYSAALLYVIRLADALHEIAEVRNSPPDPIRDGVHAYAEFWKVACEHMQMAANRAILSGAG